MLDLTIPQACCAGGEQHPELDPGHLVVAYSAQTFVADAGANPQVFWRRFIEVEIPATSP